MAGMPSVCVVVSSDVAKVQQPAQRYFLQIVHASSTVFVTRIECVFKAVCTTTFLRGYYVQELKLPSQFDFLMRAL